VRLAPGGPELPAGKTVELVVDARGMGRPATGRSLGRGLSL
jgi:hypothetical protein